MLQVTAIVDGVDRAVAGFKKAQADALKAENTAVRVEGFRLMRLLRAEIRRGAPGGRRFAPLSVIRKTMRGRGNTPIFRLARAIGYDVPGGAAGSLKIGFVGPASSATWERLARMHQSGFMTDADAPYFRKYHRGASTLRGLLAEEGSRFDKRMFGGKRGRRRSVFFLKKSTARLRTPARPIIDPFWDVHEKAARANIRSNFVRKMRGERI